MKYLSCRFILFTEEVKVLSISMVKVKIYFTFWTYYIAVSLFVHLNKSKIITVTIIKPLLFLIYLVKNTDRAGYKKTQETENFSKK